MTFRHSQPPRAPTTSRRGLVLAAGAVALAATTAACGGGGSSAGAPDVVTVTVTPTASPSTSSTTTSPTATAGPVHSDVVGRRYDLGTVVRVEQQQGQQVVVFDRWTAAGVKDGDVAARGVPVAPYADARFVNQNTRTTFRIPVAGGATFTYHHCLSVDQPMQSRASSLDELARLGVAERVLVVTLDPQGRLTAADNEPGC